jgi:DNA-binding transcriptional LysR family regulator
MPPATLSRQVARLEDALAARLLQRTTRKVASGALMLVASPTFLAARGAPQTLNDLSNHECIRAVHADGPVPWRLIGPDGPVSVPASGRFSASNH